MTEEDKCSICYESYKKDKLKIILECKHTFHFNCIKKWKEEDKDTCPLCRGKMNLNLSENKKENKDKKQANDGADLFNIFTNSRRMRKTRRMRGTGEKTEKLIWNTGGGLPSLSGGF